jgi:quercetin dioxygenase-like cupin family protein
MTVDFPWPWWVTSLVALGVAASTVIAIPRTSRLFVRGILAALLVESVLAAALAPAVMEEMDDEQKQTAMVSGPSRPLVVTGRRVPASPSYQAIPGGAELAVIEGNPSKAGSFTLWLRMPAGYQEPPHWQPLTETMTVLQGTLRFGVGERVDEEATREMRAGSVVIVPPRMRHFFSAKGETVIQVHGPGPLDIRPVKPADSG